MNRQHITALLIVAALFCFSYSSFGQFAQKGQKVSPFLARLDAGAGLGSALALSADGKTAIIGASNDWGGIGAGLIYTLTNCGWEFSTKLLGNGVGASILQGYSVDISADGVTAIVGAPKDNNGVGAAWIFTKSGGTWSQEKLVPLDASGQSNFGVSVALSADGTTAIIGGDNDNSGVGASWIFRKSGNSWSQAMNKLLGSNIISGTYTNTFTARQGRSVDISANGSIAVVGTPGHALGRGQVTIYSISSSAYTEQDYVEGNTGATLGYAVAISGNGNTIIAGYPRNDSYNGGVGILEQVAGTWSVVFDNQLSAPSTLHQGMAVALSADGNTAIVGGGGTSHAANSNNANPQTQGVGATWVMTRSGSTWSEQGKYVGFPSAGNCQQGSAVAISGDGQSFLTAGSADNDDYGAAWYFTTQNVTITVPSIADFTPKSGGEGQLVTITGTGLDCVEAVTFGYTFGQLVSKNASTVIARIMDSSPDLTGDVCVFAPGGEVCMAGFKYDQDSTSTPTAIVGLAKTSTKFTLYPNPAQTHITLTLLQPDVWCASIIIRDGVGRKVMEYPLSVSDREKTLDISALPTGLYFLEASPSLRARFMKE